MTKIRFNYRQKSTAILAGGIVIILVYLLLFQLPLFTKMRKLLSEKKCFAENGVSGDNINRKLDQLRTLNKKRSTIQEEIQSLEAHFSQSGLFLWEIMQNISNLAKELKLNVILTHPKIERETDKYQYSSLQIKLNGDFSTLYHFIFLFERYTPAIKLDSFKIEVGSAEKNALGELKLKLFTPRPDQSFHLEGHRAEKEGFKIAALELGAQSWDESWPEKLDRDIFHFPRPRRSFAPVLYSKAINSKKKKKPFKLEATFTGGQPMAVINNQPLTIGESIAGYKLQEIKDSLVVLMKNGQNIILKLEE